MWPTTVWRMPMVALKTGRTNLPQAKWLMREFEMHTPYHSDGRQILEGDGYVLNVVCQITTDNLVPSSKKHLSEISSQVDSPSTNGCCQITAYRKKGTPFTLVPKPPPTAFDGLRKQLNLVVDKLQGLKPRRATAIFKQLTVQGQILLLQGSKSANDGLPWRSKDRFELLRALRSADYYQRPLVSLAPQRIAYHITPTIVLVNLARCAVMFFRLVPKVSPQNNNLLLDLSPRPL
ncbi:hypothetical protein CSKR_106319 [Clonorchis sinensis]|uniref:Uncharacterized protein n=1 Tax=Clonorchis sinensis TaxID=79923 RepID=A0A3R7FY21_CLOSI|nr:hypothetical protein CSKR_106319 [Clonorchis sinensis]